MLSLGDLLPRPGTPTGKKTDRFPIVGIGASAGGLEALEQFLSSLPSDTGMACRIEIFYPSRADDRGPDVTGRLRKSRAPVSRVRESSGPIRVLVADDHKILRQGLASIINGEPDLELVGEAKDGREAIELARQLSPDIVIMDVEMPGTNGIDATRAIAAEMPGIRVIGLSMHTREDMEQGMRAAGASEYLPKDGPAEDLLAAIRGFLPDNPDPRQMKRR